ncbi:MAG: hypothetical protein RR348_03670, partial [Clostridia bacterium]
IVGIVVLAGLIVFAFVFKYGFIGSVGAVSIMSTYTTIAFCVIPTITLTGKSLAVALTLCWVIWALVIYKHKGNFVRFFKGQENVLDIMGKHKDENAVENKTEISESVNGKKDIEEKDIEVEKKENK